MKFPLKSNPAVNIEITPLIDIVFILVIFFVATSKISESQFLNIDLPESNYLESNEDNNWTAVQVELTQQLDGTGYSIEIVTDQNGNPNICDGETITLNPSSFTAEEYLWSNVGEPPY